MTQDHSSKLSFSIEESVWLNKGQEVDEIVSLSLDPEITVQENGDYVLIRGGLKLTGEYRSNGKNAELDEGATSLSDRVAFRSIEEVTMNEDGTGEIRHHFPIDVTIPQERIKSLEDIYVIVESFDYDLPERGCIQLTADVAITGMSTGKIEGEPTEAPRETVEQVDLQEREETVAQIDQEQEDTYQVEEQEQERAFHYEAYRQEEEATEVEEETPVDETVVSFPSEENVFNPSIERPEVNNDELQADDSEAEVGFGEVEVQVDETGELEISPVNKTTTPTVAFGVVKDKSKVEPESETEEQPKKKQQQSFSMLKDLAKDRKPRAEKNEEVQKDSNESDEQVDQAQPPREENALYLTKMLTKGEEEFKKLKICIIQENETLELIASRYEVNTSSLIRINRLNDSNVEEGQILYIPSNQ